MVYSTAYMCIMQQNVCQCVHPNTAVKIKNKLFRTWLAWCPVCSILDSVSAQL